jgi:pimeloyl-ACP methyl ester carboxylesterase
MGSVASAMALADDPHLADALVLDSAYSQLVSATKGWWYLLGGKIGTILLTPTVLLAMPLSGLNPWRIDVSQVLAKFATPVLVLHGDRDSLATPDQAKRNVTALGDRATVEWFPGCAHSEGRWIQPDRYYQALESFLKTQRMLA